MARIRLGICFTCKASVAVMTHNQDYFLLDDNGHIHKCKPRSNIKEQRRKILSEFY